MIDFGIMASEVFQTLRAFNYDVKLFTETGNQTIEPRDARRFFSKAEDLAVVILEEAENSTVKVIKSNSIAVAEIQGFTRTIKSLATKYGVLFSIEGQDGNIKPRDFTRYNIEEGRKDNMDLTEHMYGTSRSSYLKFDNARLVVKHSGKVDESKSGARTRRIDRMYVENKGGERHLLPVNQLSAGKALAQHVNKGGDLLDETAKHICKLSEDHQKLGKVLRHIRKNCESLSESADGVKDSAAKSRGEIRSVFEKIFKDYDKGVERLNENLLVEASIGEISEAKDRLKSALTCEGVEIEEELLETMAHYSFDLEKKPLEEKESDLVDIGGTNVDREAFLAFAQDSTLNFSKSLDSYDYGKVDFKDDRSIVAALDSFCRFITDDGLSNLVARVSEAVGSGTATKLDRQIAIRAIKIAETKVVVESLRNPVVLEHFNWLDKFSIENIFLNESSIADESDCGTCDADEDEDRELSREDVLLPKDPDADLKNNVASKEVLLDDTDEDEVITHKGVEYKSLGDGRYERLCDNIVGRIPGL